jgi:hypothetical protein
MFKYLFWALSLYVLFRFVFSFLIPVYRATRQMRSQMKDFHNRMEGQQDYQHTSANADEAHKSKVKEGDYIDFEEIK